MAADLAAWKDEFIQALGRISDFWGFGKMTGQLYGLLYLSPQPLTLDDMKDALCVSKGNVSVHIRNLERWGMARKLWIKGDRKDYYEAETDFWKMIRTILSEREEKEFTQGLATLKACLEHLTAAETTAEVEFYRQRLTHIRDFFAGAQRAIEALLSLDQIEARALAVIELLETFQDQDEPE